MADLNSLQKPFRKLRKTLKSLRRDPAPNVVHRLRTQIRKAEAAVHAFTLDQKRNGLRLLKVLKPARRAAGKVRDIDVFVRLASTLPAQSSEECLVELLESLGMRRTRAAENLDKVVTGKKKEIRRRLRRCSKMIEKRLSASGAGSPGSVQISTGVAVRVKQLESELERWPKLSKGNLHPYRLKVKELGYTLQLEQEGDFSYMQTLREVKDRIGRWHDWDALAKIADKVLEHRSACELTEQIAYRAQDELIKALSASKRMDEQYFNIDNSTRKSQRTPNPIGLNTSSMKVNGEYR